MRFHLNHSKQEQESYLSAVEKARVSTKIEEKAAARAKGKTAAASSSKAEGDGGDNNKESKNQRKKREFRQRQAVNAGGTPGADREESQGERAGSRKQLDDVLGRLF